MHFPWQAPRIIISKVYGAQQMAKTHTIMASDFAIFLSRCSFDLVLAQKETEKSFSGVTELPLVGDELSVTKDSFFGLVEEETLSSASDGEDVPGVGKRQNLQDRLPLLGGSQSCVLPCRWRLWMLWKMNTLK